MPSRLSRRLLARLMLAGFALALIVAAASPLVQPRAMQLVCSAQGVIKLMVDTEDGLADAGRAHGADCALCLPGGAPPLAARCLTSPLRVVAATVAALPSQVPVVARTQAPPPARGPPAGV